ncbi:MAG: DUF2812 domain-containing protein [Lachnospiraceae bacterium]|nr:DUF2812 domain-containing protein [Lachnospiraceae bacterium]
MNTDTKRFVRFFTITDYEAEEQWLHEMYLKGWKPLKFTPPCFYVFEACEPADMIFRLEFHERSVDTQPEYLKMVNDYGWEYLFSCTNWRYFCKPASPDDQSNELFTDNSSRMEMVWKIARRRYLPIAVIFLCCVLPYTIRTFSGEFEAVLGVLWICLFLFYTILLLYCGAGLLRLRKKFR